MGQPSSTAKENESDGAESLGNDYYSSLNSEEVEILSNVDEWEIQKDPSKP